MAEGSEFAMQQIQQMMGNLTPMLQQAAQIVQSKMPQPPVDPAVQKTFEAAMAEIERKKAADAQMFQLKQGEMQNDAAAEQQKQAIDMRLAEMGNALKLQITAMQEEGSRAAEELRAQIALMKNEQDNEQKQMTELIKNYQDNLTQLQLALQAQQSQVEDLSSRGQPAPPDLTPQVEQLNAMLAQVEKQRGQDALVTVTQGLQAVIESLNRPKMIVEDENGRPIGIR